MYKGVECTCDSDFTCRHCLNNRKPWLFTPTKSGWDWARGHERAKAEAKQLSGVQQ